MNEDVDYAAVAQVTEQAREVVAAMVAGFVADGFTDREARRLTVALLAPNATEGQA